MKTVKAKGKETVEHNSFANATRFDALTDPTPDEHGGETTNPKEHAQHEIVEKHTSGDGAERWRRVQVEHQPTKLVSILERGSGEICEMAQSDWVPLPKPLVVDSGAGETVMPADWLPAHPTNESAGSKKNEYYTTADGSKVYNEGQKNVIISTLDGSQERAMTFQVAQVHKALGSVSQMVRNGNRVVFDTDEYGRDVSYIMNKKSKESIPMRVENGVYVIDVVVAPPGYHPLQSNRRQTSDCGWGFPRQG